MPDLRVVEPGASSIQGLGRYGAQRYGIAPGGAMDRLALAEVNALVGQNAGSAAVEIGPLPARFVVEGGMVRAAVTGAPREILIDDRPHQMGATALAPRGSVITIRGARGGQFSYLSFQGGLQGCSRDHHAAPRHAETPDTARSWILEAGDVIALRPAGEAQQEKRLRLHGRSTAPIRVVLGPQLDYFDEAAVGRFLSATWSVSHASNRMAYLLEGARIALHKGHNIVSDGTVTGNIQIAGSGQPLVILCDRGTVGGYPKIATIISADIGRFAQIPQSGVLNFEAVSVLEAETVAREFAVRLSSLKPKVEMVDPSGVSLDVLLECNLAGDVFDAVHWRSSSPSTTNPETGSPA